MVWYRFCGKLKMVLHQLFCVGLFSALWVCSYAQEAANSSDGSPVDDSANNATEKEGGPSIHSLGTLPIEYLSRTIKYQCQYYTDLTKHCMKVRRCDNHLRGANVKTGDDKEIYMYPCQGEEIISRWKISDGIAKPALFDYIGRNTPMAFTAFACAFFEQAEIDSPPEAPKSKLFECSDPIDRSVPGSETPFSGGIPWNGVWHQEGTWIKGTITAIAIDDAP